MSLREFEESPLVVGAGGLWREATEAEFLSAIHDGNLPREAFQRWLVQDYSFAKGLATFQAIAVAKTPRSAQKVLIGGLSALDAELEWLEQNAQRQALDLDAALHPTCRRYIDCLIASAYTQPFEVLLAVLYGVEASYLCAWSSLEASGPYRNSSTVGRMACLWRTCAGFSMFATGTRTSYSKNSSTKSCDTSETSGA